jgi:hypothetical protein
MLTYADSWSYDSMVPAYRLAREHRNVMRTSTQVEHALRIKSMRYALRACATYVLKRTRAPQRHAYVNAGH